MSQEIYFFSKTVTYYIHQGTYVTPSTFFVSLFLSLSVSNNYTGGMFMKILPKMYLWTRKN